MKVFYTLQKRMPKDRKPTVLTVGNFDGIHLGHQKMIKKIVQEAKKHSHQSAIITFVNHPAQVIRPHKCPLRITPNDFRIQLFEALGIDELYILEFSTEFSGQSTSHFLEHLSESLKIERILMGHDAAIGKNREGDFPHMKKLGESLHFIVDEFPPVLYNEEIVSSTRVRKAIAEGDFSLARHLLGRPYSIYGKVVTGKGRGKTIGFPTANMDVTGLCLPPLGVYAVDVKIGKESYRGIANLGYAPTLKNSDHVSLEVHLFDFQQSLYDQSIEVVFKKFIRPEMKFSSVEALIEQIQKDVLKTQ